MQALGLGGMAAAYQDLADHSNADDLSRDEWLGLMLDREAAMRADKRLTNGLAVARLRFADACIESIDFAAHRGLDRRNTLSLAQGAWLKAHENLIITGQTDPTTQCTPRYVIEKAGSADPVIVIMGCVRSNRHRQGDLFRHPDRNQRQAAIRLSPDIGRLTAITLTACDENLPART
ncbi:ATP-binding protein [Mesorhizobium sp. LNHC252B00]|uniref:ATP-binding protein n=1 Tax=Mesorhizobium sp. LNHC252B00 TaxID=1287252 RepID=UPI0024781EFF|nr:ATP-binding protein [Mesorhizobium sp. LNHC252B00]